MPGLAAQSAMAPHGRIRSDYDPSPPGARLSAVLLLILPGNHLVFIRRSNDGRRHSGQIAFPGGLWEEDDDDLITTALRETREEIGVDVPRADVLGVLSPLYIPVSDTSVLPVVAWIREEPQYRPEPLEVDEVIVLPIDGFAAAMDEMEIHREGGPLRAPCYRFGSVEVWGATAMITAEFLGLWTEANHTPTE